MDEPPTTGPLFTQVRRRLTCFFTGHQWGLWRSPTSGLLAAVCARCGRIIP